MLIYSCLQAALSYVSYCTHKIPHKIPLTQMLVTISLSFLRHYIVKSKWMILELFGP